MESGEVDALEAADVDHDGCIPRLIRSTTEGLHAADLAEEMGDFLGIEAILSEHILSGEEREVGRWHEGQDEALLLAMRTVARHRVRQVRLDLVSHRPAMTPARIFLHSSWL